MYLACLIFALVFYENIKADDLNVADSHGPISVVGDHMHNYGEVMFSYRFVNMKMHGLLNGKKSIGLRESMNAPNSASNGSGTYMNSPVSMNMDMHMLGIMYAPSNYLTFMLMTNYVEKEMQQERMPMLGSSRFDVNSNGLGDTRITALIKLRKNNYQKSIIGLGISFPTGSIDKRDSTPTSLNTRLGYSMQNGTGTFDPYMFLNNVYNSGKFKIGGQILFKSSLSNHNSKGYHYGNLIDLKTWFSYRWLKNFSSAMKINYLYQGRMQGFDNEMNRRMSPAMDSRNQGFNKLNIGFSVNFINQKKLLKNHRMGIEVLCPVFQNVRGIQMSKNIKTILGWQYSF